MEFNEMYDMLADDLCINTDSLDLAFAIGGCNQETAERILFYYTGWRTFKGWIDSGEDE